MGKRRRLGPASLVADAGAPGPRAAPPIAQVAGAAATEAALAALSDEIQSARETGRLIQALPLSAIDPRHLSRDRVALERGELEALKTSIAARGQQTPIDVVALPGGRYGLISGLRRFTALQELHAAAPAGGFDTVLAVLRPQESAAAAYRAMVEENELRVGLSYYERAQVAVQAVEQGAFDTVPEAIAALFATASKAKRSKIASFVRIHRGLGDLLRFPSEIPERLGLQLAKALDAGQGRRLRAHLEAAPAPTGPEEMAVLTRALQVAGQATPGAAVPYAAYGEDLELHVSRTGLQLKGPGATEALAKELAAWLAERHRRQSSD